MNSADPETGHPLTDPGQLMLAGDWHGDAAWARHVIRHAPIGSNGRRLIIQLGDFGVWPGHSGVRYLDSVEAALADVNAVCLFVDGNHEDFPQLARYPICSDGLREIRPRLFHLSRGTRWVWQGLRFLALGGATSLDRPWRSAGVDWWPDEGLTRADLDRAIAGGPCDVMLTHDAPTGIDVPGLPPRLPGNPQRWNERTAIVACCVRSSTPFSRSGWSTVTSTVGTTPSFALKVVIGSR